MKQKKEKKEKQQQIEKKLINTWWSGDTIRTKLKKVKERERKKKKVILYSLLKICEIGSGETSKYLYVCNRQNLTSATT